MLEFLTKGKDELGWVGVKSEFEAEGARKDEVIFLNNLVKKAGLNLGIKIGGCEAISDLINCKLMGVDYIIAPMVETPYALSKYMAAKDKVFSSSEKENIKFLFNLETITAYNNLDDFVELINKSTSKIDGIVFGRGDFACSLNLDRSRITDSTVTDACVKVASVCKKLQKEFVVGGAVSTDTVDSLHTINKQYLTRFETRKVIFDSSILNKDTEESIKYALLFELLWLKHKYEFYNSISLEDDKRLKILENRLL
ncbi:MAG: aldolase [Legionellales bacterium]|nr:aldolase [Legionellales bacterium]